MLKDKLQAWHLCIIKGKPQSLKEESNRQICYLSRPCTWEVAWMSSSEMNSWQLLNTSPTQCLRSVSLDMARQLHELKKIKLLLLPCLFFYKTESSLHKTRLLTLLSTMKLVVPDDEKLNDVRKFEMLLYFLKYRSQCLQIDKYLVLILTGNWICHGH